MVDPTPPQPPVSGSQTPPRPPVSSGQTPPKLPVIGGANPNSDSGSGVNNNSGRGSGFTIPEMPSFMTNNNFNGGIGYSNNNLNDEFGYGYPFDGGYNNSGGGGQNSLQVNVKKLDGSNYAKWSQTV